MEETDELKAEIDALKTEIEFLKTGRYGLVWEWEENDTPVIPVHKIKFAAEREINPEYETVHQLIKGDNLAVMEALEPDYAETIDCIYIDPPYNTGKVNEFAYRDDYADKEAQYRHSLWLSFMKPRLEKAKTFLKEEGIIFISIDDNQQAHLKLLMDAIFGERNFIATLAVSNLPSGRSLNRFFAQNHEYVLVYAKNVKKTKYKPSLPDKNLNAKFPHADKDGAYSTTGLMNSHQQFGPHNRPNLHYPLYVGTSADEHTKVFIEQNIDGTRAEVWPAFSDGRPGVWTWGKPKSEKEAHLLEGREQKDNTWRIVRKKYAQPQQRTKIKTFLDHHQMGQTTQAGKALKAILGENSFFGAKPVDYIKTIVNSFENKNIKVLDFFAGSGTTGQAVAELNFEDGGKRECILITDQGKAQYDTEGNKSNNEIDVAEEIAYVRMERVLTGLKWADGKKHPDLKQGLKFGKII